MEDDQGGPADVRRLASQQAAIAEYAGRTARVAG
jgi:hypothetical protein